MYNVCKSFIHLILCAVILLSLTAISYASGKRADDAQQIEIALKGSLQNPASSPDSQSILFTRWRKRYNAGRADLFILNLKSGALQKLISANCANVNLPGSSWNPKTDQIVFSSDCKDDDEIYTCDPSGKPENKIQITNQKQRMNYEPTFSPDGKWIVFESHPLDVEGHGIITKYNLKGAKEYIQMTDLQGDCRQPNWSPTGEHILYQKKEKDSWNIWLMNADGTHHRKVTMGKGDKTDATFSPNGKWIIYSSDDHGELRFANIFAIPVNGGDAIQITHYKGYDGAPSCSNDGKIIFFESTNGDPDHSKGTTLWQINVPTELTHRFYEKIGLGSI